MGVRKSAGVRTRDGGAKCVPGPPEAEAGGARKQGPLGVGGRRPWVRGRWTEVSERPVTCSHSHEVQWGRKEVP